jgi:hypothetical protein
MEVWRVKAGNELRFQVEGAGLELLVRAGQRENGARVHDDRHAVIDRKGHNV